MAIGSGPHRARPPASDAPPPFADHLGSGGGLCALSVLSVPSVLPLLLPAPPVLVPGLPLPLVVLAFLLFLVVLGGRVPPVADPEPRPPSVREVRAGPPELRGRARTRGVARGHGRKCNRSPADPRGSVSGSDSVEDHRTVIVEEHPIFEVPAESAGQHRALDVPTDP